MNANRNIIITILISLTFVGYFVYVENRTTISSVNDELGEVELVRSFTFNNETIELSYTDDNTNETLIIHSDREIYGAWSDTDVFFSIENIGTLDEEVKIRFLAGENENPVEVFELKKDATTTVEIDDIRERIFDFSKAREFGCVANDVDIAFPNTDENDSDIFFFSCGDLHNFCDTITTETRTIDDLFCTVNEFDYGRITVATTTDIFNSLIGLSEQATRNLSELSRVREGFLSKRRFTSTIKAGETKYYKATMTFDPLADRKEFYICANGSEGGRGCLDPWFDSNFKFRQRITINSSQVTFSPSEFPVLVTSTQSIYRSDGGGLLETPFANDFIFVDTDNTTLLDYEREKHDGNTGEVHYWIDMDISSTTDKIFYIYMGNPDAVSQSNPAGVWPSADYTGVWHLDESPNDEVRGHINSVSSSFAGRPRNFATTSSMLGTTDALTQIDGGDFLDGSDDYVGIFNNNSLEIQAHNYFASGWASTTESVNAQMVFMADKFGGTSEGFRMQWRDSTNADCPTGEACMKYTIQDSAAAKDYWSTGVDVSDGKNHLYAFTWDRSADDLKIYIDGQQQVANKVTDDDLSASTIDGDLCLNLGAAGQTCATFFAVSTWNGDIDEMRIGNTAFSPQYFSTGYNNQICVSCFLSFGAIERVDGMKLDFKDNSLLDSKTNSLLDFKLLD